MILEQEAAKTWSHDEIVTYLNEAYDTPPEWSELIARAYGQKLGRKPVGLTASSGFQIGVRRTLPLSKEQLWAYLTSTAGIQLWIGDMPFLELKVGHKFITKDGTSGELRVVKPLEQLRMTWQRKDWERASTLQIRLLSAHPDKTTISIHQEKLEDLFVREQMKLHWEEAAAQILEQSKGDE
ncbi:SRPBCC domain-containing protein [Paenibacillus sp. WST5]|uniref:SRPBCC domain-containing protein n=2 Tax=Paenibacillus sedimenti TaxID=2770274 RepID=A0A926KUE9_9BACL|nr:SRPBCC domain-containing protein [Paenibacillus sedimenti]